MSLSSLLGGRSSKVSFSKGASPIPPPGRVGSCDPCLSAPGQGHSSSHQGGGGLGPQPSPPNLGRVQSGRKRTPTTSTTKFTPFTNTRVRCVSLRGTAPAALALCLARPGPPPRPVPGSPPPPPPPRLSALSSRRQLSGPRQLRALPPPVALSAVGAGQPSESGSSGVGRERRSSPGSGGRLPSLPGTASPILSCPTTGTRLPPPCSRTWGSEGLSKPKEGMKCGRHPPERPVRAERTGWGGLADRCSSGSAGAHAHPLALAVTLAPPHPLGRATGPGREGPTGRGDTPYTARPALPGLGPGRSFFGQRRGPGRGPRPRAGWGTGLQCPTPKYGSRRGATFLRGGAGGSARGLYKT